jgi:hypothetical protein
LPPHIAQRQPARSSSPDALTTALYLLESQSSTKTKCSRRPRGSQTCWGRRLFGAYHATTHADEIVVENHESSA